MPYPRINSFSNLGSFSVGFVFGNQRLGVYYVHCYPSLNAPRPSSWTEPDSQTVCVYIYICVCVCVYTHIYMYMHTYIYNHTHTHTHTHISLINSVSLEKDLVPYIDIFLSHQFTVICRSNFNSSPRDSF